jgi:hypothetical protein
MCFETGNNASTILRREEMKLLERLQSGSVNSNDLNGAKRLND